MNNSSSWNCFSWIRRDRNSNKDGSDKKTPKKQHHKEGIPDEQFANLLGDANLSTRRDLHEGILNKDQEDEMFVYGYKKSTFRSFLCYLGIGLTLGLMRLVMHWWSHWLLLATHKPCSLEQAEKVLVKEKFQGKHAIYYVKNVITLTSDNIRESIKNAELNECFSERYTSLDNEFNRQLEIHLSDGKFQQVESVRLFICKKLRYIWEVDSSSFVKLRGLDENVPSVTIHKHRGISDLTRSIRRLVYGDNKIDVVIKSWGELLFLEALNPFYVFQVFSVVLWFSYNYYYYACVIILMTAFGIFFSIRQTLKNQKALYATVFSVDTATVVKEDKSSVVMDTKFLVPGDILKIPSSGCTMQCDAVLLSGNCILDESMLTGESVPVTKTPLPCKKDLIYDMKEHARHTLFSGTKIIQTRYIGSEQVLAVVINTGNITAKGALIRSILYPPPVDYKFEQDSYKFVALLASVAFVGFLYTVVTKVLRGVGALKIAVESLDLITIAVPPALPAAMSVGRMYAQKRLQKKNIFCIAPRSINVSGSIDCVCFDKTGTLTEDGLDMYGVVPKTATNTLQIPLKQIDRLPFDHLLYGMVTCHSITLMNGEMKGDPLDLKMFESTSWKLEEANVSDDTKYDLLFPTVVKPPTNNSKGSQPHLLMQSPPSESQLDTLDINSHDIGIVREFSFTSSLQRMAVITRKLTDGHFNVYCKGSPEMIATLCRQDTLPTDFNEKLNFYAQQGYRIIAMAYKPLEKKLTYPKIQRISRDKVESDLEFLGFVILENRLKPDSEKVIKILNDASIRTVMITGDNILTAVSVAKDCDMILEDQSIIIVNSRWITDDEPELFYTLEGHSTSATATNNMNMIKTPASIDFVDASGDGKYKIMTNSNSASSLATVETNTYSNNLQRDVEKGGPLTFITKKRKLFSNDNNDSDYRLAPELPSNRYRFAMDGKTWAIVREYYPDLLPKFVTRGTIFARMSPDQKMQLVTELQDLGYYVAMCGDGANDCGALKVAHAGISLSDAESSVASPFTSRDRTINCVPAIIREGRTALVTSFGIFKYMAAYSLVQFSSVIILYGIDSNLTDMQFLYIDLCMISVFAFFFGKTESFEGPLVKQTPLNSLVALSPVVSLMLHLITSISIQIFGWFHVQTYDWFVPFEYEESGSINSETLGCHQNYTIFIISCFQYITLAVVFSKGAPYRKTIFSNRGFLIALVINLLITCYLGLYPADWTISLMQLVAPPSDALLGFGIILVIIGAINFTLGLFIEEFIVEYIIFKKLRYRFHNIEKSHKKFLSIENYLRLNTKWPPLSLYNNQENNSPSDDDSKNQGGNSGASKGPSTGHDDDDDDTSPMSYAEISIEPVEDDAVVFDRNSSILNSFFERERQRLASINRGSSQGEHKVVDDNDNVFGSVVNPDNLPIRKKNEQLKREYLELKIADPAKPFANGFMEGSFMSTSDNSNNKQEDDEVRKDVELHNMSSSKT
ncbi:polyamine-transporting ATPase 13A3 isoform X2 [Chironomus tepperi]|uniref:polyamine-transporting ATPase 13A3 isoform X2 n=1 Tax=Chironomus tepperi TaxID=113505 RepID=UPI00391FC277